MESKTEVNSRNSCAGFSQRCWLMRHRSRATNAEGTHRPKTKKEQSLVLYHPQDRTHTSHDTDSALTAVVTHVHVYMCMYISHEDERAARAHGYQRHARVRERDTTAASTARTMKTNPTRRFQVHTADDGEDRVREESREAAHIERKYTLSQLTPAPSHVHTPWGDSE